MERKIGYIGLLLAIIALIGVLSSGCSMYSVLPEECAVDSPQSLIAWIHDGVEYKIDYLNYWKSPRETLASGEGDCEDFCILFASMAHDLWGWKPDMKLIYVPDHGFHYMLVYQNIIYDVTNKFIGEDYPFDYTMLDVIDYDVFIWWSTAGYIKSVE